MADDKINTLSRSLTESFVRKQVKALKKSPDRTIRNMVDMALNLSKGKFQKYFFQAAQEMLQDDQCGYYRLFHDVLVHVGTEHLITFGMNVGYNSFTGGAKIIRKNEEKLGHHIPWSVFLRIDTNEYEKMAPHWKSLIMDGKKLGIYSYLLLLQKNPWKLLPFIKKEADCAFFLFCPASCLTEKFLDAARKAKNLLISVEYSAASREVFYQLRRRKLPYAIHVRYRETDIPKITDGIFLSEISRENPVFTFFIPRKVPAPDSRRVYDYVVSERYHLKYPTIPFELGNDLQEIDRIISDNPAATNFRRIDFAKDGSLLTDELGHKDEKRNYTAMPLSSILAAD